MANQVVGMNFISDSTNKGRTATPAEETQKVQETARRTAGLLKDAASATTGAQVRDAVENFSGKAPVEGPALKK